MPLYGSADNAGSKPKFLTTAEKDNCLAADATETAASSKIIHQGWTIPRPGSAMRETIVAMNIVSDIGGSDDAAFGLQSYDSSTHEASPVSNQFGSGMEQYTSTFLTVDNLSATTSLSGGAGAHFYLNTIASTSQMDNVWASLGFLAGQNYSPNGYKITMNARVRDLAGSPADFAGWPANIIFQMKITGNPTHYQYDIDASSIVSSDSTKTFADWVQAKSDADATGSNPPYKWEIQLYKGIPALQS